jgi:carbonic anhydrase
MRLFEAIIEANNRAVAGDTSAGLHPDEFADELPIIALTCVDPRLNALLPSALGVPVESFIWLRNAGNIITGPLSSTMRSLALACAVKGGREIAVIGHTDCLVCKTTSAVLLDRLLKLGIQRSQLPDNVNEFFGVFASERQNVIKACEIIRLSPIIGPKVPVHGLLLDVNTGKVEWLVNGYETWAKMGDQLQETAQATGQGFEQAIGQKMGELKPFANFEIGEMKFPEAKIGETVTKAEDWFANQARQLETSLTDATAKPSAVPTASQTSLPIQVVPPSAPRRIPVPPPIRPRPDFKRK